MKRVLAIEDNAVVANVYRATLARDGRLSRGDRRRRTTGSQCGRARSTDIVMLDLMLPKVPGLEVLRAIRAQLPDVPVIVTSNSFTNERMDAVWTAGATQVLTKASSSPKEIARIVREALERPAEKRGTWERLNARGDAAGLSAIGFLSTSSTGVQARCAAVAGAR